MGCRISHISWNPVLPTELAFACTDGSIGLLKAASSAPGVKNDLRRRTLKEPGRVSWAALVCCEWSHHPRLLYYSAGRLAAIEPTYPLRKYSALANVNGHHMCALLHHFNALKQPPECNLWNLGAVFRIRMIQQVSCAVNL